MSGCGDVSSESPGLCGTLSEFPGSVLGHWVAQEIGCTGWFISWLGLAGWLDLA